MFSTSSKNEDPWYLHAGLYLVIAILTFLLIKVAVIDPKGEIDAEKYYKREARLRMANLKEAEILYDKKYKQFTNNVDKLVEFIKTDKFVDSVVNAFDSTTMKPANPFKPLSDGIFTPDSLYRTPKSNKPFIVQIDTSISNDTVVNQRGKVLRVDTKKLIGTKYYIEDPDGFGTIGSLDNDALKNTASWE
jgi:hypothetical protein